MPSRYYVNMNIVLVIRTSLFLTNVIDGGGFFNMMTDHFILVMVVHLKL